MTGEHTGRERERVLGEVERGQSEGWAPLIVWGLAGSEG